MEGPRGLLWLQRGLMATFVGTITLWYFTSPYLVRPHPSFGEDMARLVGNLSSPGAGGRIENWTKWRLYLGKGEGRAVVHAMSSVDTGGLEFPLMAQFEWRPAYHTVVSRNWWYGSLSAEERRPWYSSFGIYDHYHTEVVKDRTVRWGRQCTLCTALHCTAL
jgi:hypothetical protein